MGRCVHVYKSFHKSWGFAVKLFFTAPSFMQRLGPFVWQSLFLASRRQAWQRRPFGCAACRCFLFCCKRAPGWSVWAMVSKKPPWRLAGQRAFPDPSAHRSAAFAELAALRGGGPGKHRHTVASSGSSIRIIGRHTAAEMPPTSFAPLPAHPPAKGAAPSSAVFVLAQGSWPQAGCLLPAGQPGAGANGAGIGQCFPVSPPLCARSFAEAVAFSCIARIACFRCDCPGNRAATLQRGSEAWYNK